MSDRCNGQAGADSFVNEVETEIIDFYRLLADCPSSIITREMLEAGVAALREYPIHAEPASQYEAVGSAFLSMAKELHARSIKT